MKRVEVIGSLLCVCLLLVAAGSAIAADKADGEKTFKPRPAPRFIDNNDGTVTDNLTSLIWLKDADCFGLHTWDDALELAGSLGNGQCGLSDGSKAGQWRVPDRKELASLVGNQEGNLAAWLNQQGFLKVRSNIYWTSTGSDRSTNIAWFVEMNRGGAYSGGTSYLYYIWPVRGGK
jgi:uncharacterized protein DUF1566